MNKVFFNKFPVPQIPKVSLRQLRTMHSATKMAQKFTTRPVPGMYRPQYTRVLITENSRWHTGVLMLAENVSLGVLALPQALAILGLVPGLLCIFFLGVIATYTGWIIGEFKIAHPSVQSFADCGMLITGPIGRDVMAVGQVLVLVFIMGAHILSFSIAMNAITGHVMCTIWWNVIGLVLCFGLGLPRTFKKVSFLSIFCKSDMPLRASGKPNEAACVSIIVAVLVAMIAIGIQKPDTGNILAVRPDVPLVKGLGPVLNIILAYSTSHTLPIS
jgi:hypothetical protein